MGMQVKCDLINTVIDYIVKARMAHPEVLDSDLIKDENDTSDLPYTIYYMNGNDGTDFDYSANNRTCEFVVFYKKSEMGFIRVMVGKRVGSIHGYVYADGGIKPLEKGGVLEEEYADMNSVNLLAYQLWKYGDCKNIYDEPICNIDFDCEIDTDDAREFIKMTM